jgi:cytochrome P450
VFDALGELTFPKRYGFIDRGTDVDNIMADIWHHFERVSLVGQVPWIDTFLRINPLLSRFRPQPVSPVVKFSIARMQERKARSDSTTNERDLLSRFLAAQANTPELPPWALSAWITGNITAGSHTTARILRTVFYFLLKNPDTLKSLRQELTMAKKEGRLLDPPTWKEVQNLTYLDACLKEAQRIHAPIGMHLERVVPNGGRTICGKYLKASVGNNLTIKLKFL